MKTNFKGTKGKWKVCEKSILETSVSTSKYRVCECKHYDEQIVPNLLEPTKEEGMYNALLISKAPEMLERLEKMRQAILSEDYVRMLAESELAKQLIKEATEL